MALDKKFFEDMEARIPHGKVRTRFAPSPTGYMHVGNLRTALYTWLIARHAGGTFILRIEDTDQGRLVEGATDVIYRTMKECGLDHDEGPDVGGPTGPYIQSERRDLYLPYAQLLVEKGAAGRAGEAQRVGVHGDGIQQALGPLVKIFKDLLAQAALLRGLLQQFLIVERNSQLLCDADADLLAAAAKLPSDGDHGFHEKSSLFFALRTRISVKGHGCNLPFYFSMNRTLRQMGTCSKSDVYRASDAGEFCVSASCSSFCMALWN